MFPKSSEHNLVAKPLVLSSTKYLEPEHPRRHCFVWFTDAGDLFEEVNGETPQDDLVSLRDWIGKGRPVIVRRPCLSEDKKTISAGLALPPNPTKRRLAFCLPVSLISKIADPPLWRDCMVPADSEIAAAAESIQTAATATGLPLQTFGSYAWQHHTALPYVTQHSDIDLLVPIDGRENWEKFRQSMAKVSRKSQKIDLEIVLQGNASFHWREFEAPGAQMLFKGNLSVWIGNKSSVETLLSEKNLVRVDPGR